MRVAAVVCSYGRASLAQLLACVERQTEPLQTLLWLDNAPDVQVHEPESVWVMRGPRMSTIGAMRAAAVDAARDAFRLEPEDGFLVLDDDDFYAPQHFEVTRRELERSAGWVSSLSIGIQHAHGGAIEHCRAEAGLGQHATWGLQLALYDAAGGYPDDAREDMALAWSLGFKRCQPHWHTTHVRRHHAANLSGSGASFDRDRVRQLDNVEPVIRARWTPECDYLAAWCASREGTAP